MKLLPTAALAAVLAVAAHQTVLAQPANRATLDQVTAAAARMFDAAEREDAAAWNAATGADFLAYEGGQRYDRASFLAFIGAAHAKGIHFRWSVAKPRLETAGDVATLIYVNDGAIIRNGVSAPMRWLETTTFRRQDGSWKAVFTESMRMAAPGR
jgi:hypothetical protein